jgi:hypothetical protein
MTSVAGILSISNAVGLNYPFCSVLTNLATLCDCVFIGVDPSFPEDEKRINTLEYDYNIVTSFWNRKNKDRGTEIALQTDKVIEKAREEGADWVVVMQADELLHEKDFDMLRLFMKRADLSTTGFSMKRLYFWKDLKTVRKDWNADLVRIFRPGTRSFMAKGTDKAGMYSGKLVPGKTIELPYYIYHYSRVGDPKEISRRVRNLDSLFHEDITLIPEEDLPSYDFVPRKHDQFSIEGFPEEVEGEFEIFSGTHPVHVPSFFIEEAHDPAN